MTAPITPPIRAEIDARLAAVEADEGVRLLLAVESGSRAWGFPSPDSDYDVRFLYVRPRDWYLALKPGRDVIEQPITDAIDLNGWDIRKALGLLVKGNAVVSEWIESPIHYRPADPAIGRLTALADALFDARACGWHYFRLGTGSAERWLGGGDPVPVKKYFYALRPVLAIRALRRAPDRRPPMNLQRLIEASDLPAATTGQITALVEAKARTNERANGMRLPEIDALIREELGKVGELPARTRTADGVARANQYFLDLVNT